MKKKMLLIVSIILLFICFGSGYMTGKRAVVIQKDTITVQKTITQYKPDYKNIQIVDTQKFKIPMIVVFPESEDSLKYATIYLQHSLDSLKHFADSLEIELQRVQKYYADEDYEAWVSGIDPVLDSIKVKQQIQQITTTHVVKPNAFDLNVGLNVDGWNKILHTLNPNINASYKIKRITITGEVGYQIPIYEVSQTTPYFQIGVNYSLWSF